MSLRIKLATGPLPTTGSTSVPWIFSGSASGAVAEPSALSPTSVFRSVLSEVQLGLWEGRVPLARPGGRKPTFLGKGRLRKRSGLPQPRENSQFCLKNYRALHPFPAPPSSGSGPVLWESVDSGEARGRASCTVSSSMSLSSSCHCCLLPSLNTEMVVSRWSWPSSTSPA